MQSVSHVYLGRVHIMKADQPGLAAVACKASRTVHAVVNYPEFRVTKFCVISSSCLRVRTHIRRRGAGRIITQRLMAARSGWCTYIQRSWRSGEWSGSHTTSCHCTKMSGDKLSLQLHTVQKCLAINHKYNYIPYKNVLR